MKRIRYHVGRYVYYIGFRILPANMRRGLSCMSALGIAWAKGDPKTFQQVIDGTKVIEWSWKSPTPAEGQ